MPIKYFRLRRKITKNSIPEYRYIAKIQVESKVGFEQLAEIIEKKSTVSRGDILGVLSELEEASFWMLENGHPVTLGLFGTYYPVIEATAVDTPEEVTIKTIKRFKMLFKPSKYLKKRFKEVKFVLGDNRVREVHYKKD